MLGGKRTGGCVASAGTKNFVKVEGRMDSTQYQQIIEYNVQEKIEVTPGLDISTMTQSTAQNLLTHSCSGTNTMFWNGHPSPQT